MLRWQRIGWVFSMAACVGVFACLGACAAGPPLRGATTAPADARILVCLDRSRDDLAAELKRAVPRPEVVVAGRDERCRRAALAADTVTGDCLTRPSGCSLPQYVDGIALAEPESRVDYVLILTHLSERTESVVSWAENHDRPVPLHFEGHSAGEAIASAAIATALTAAGGGRASPNREQAVVPGLSGPIYLSTPADGRIIGARELRGASPREIRDALAELMKLGNRPAPPGTP